MIESTTLCHHLFCKNCKQTLTVDFYWIFFSWKQDEGNQIMSIVANCWFSWKVAGNLSWVIVIRIRVKDCEDNCQFGKTYRFFSEPRIMHWAHTVMRIWQLEIEKPNSFHYLLSAATNDGVFMWSSVKASLNSWWKWNWNPMKITYK